MKIADSDAYKMLEKYNIAAAKWSLARNLREAELAAENLHFPIILKIDSPGVMHKMKSGCVRTVFHRDHLRKMFDTVMKNAKRQTKQINGVIMQELIYSNAENVHELIVGAKRDPQFGPVIMFGAGGRLTDEKDVCFRLVPISKNDALDMLSEPKISRLLARKGKIAAILQKVSKMMEFENKIGRA